jgi:hypothetical protein
MRHDRRPAWLIDIKWLSAIVLVASVAVASLAAAAARVTDPARGEGLARTVLTLTLGPAVDEVEVTATARGYEPGRPLAVLPGIDVFVDPTELDAFTVDDAVSRVAGVLAERVLSDGAPATWQRVEDPAWRAQLQALDRTTLRPLANAALQRSLLGVGLDNGTRAANWPAQAAQNPGQPVQPLVGIFVRVMPSELTGRSHRQVGERVVDALAQVLADEGAAAAQALVTNANVGEALRAALDGPVRRDLHAAIATSVAGREAEIAARLAEARSVVVGTVERDDPWAGVLPESEAAGLSPEAQRERVQTLLARRAVAAGSDGVLELVSDGPIAARLSAAAPAVDAVSRASHRRFLTLAWIAGAVAALAAFALVATTYGAGRVLWPGLCLLAAAGPGLALAWWWRQVPNDGVWPAGPVADGAALSLWRTLRLIVGSLAPVVADGVYWVYLLVAGTGSALVVIAAAAWLGAQVRPRRRSAI